MNTEAAPAPTRVTRWQLLGLGSLLFVVSTAQTWWANSSDDRLGRSVAALASPGDIRLFSSETCASCQLARQWLVEHQVPFKECLIERDAACQAEHQATGLPGTPVFKVRGQQQFGFSPGALERALQKPGKSAPALKDL